MNYSNYTRQILILGIALLLALGSYTAYNDPYWIFRESPPWLEAHKGHNRVLDIRLRHAKAMQLLTRQPEHVILGSSRVYRGFDMNQCDGFNLGLPRLRIAEAEAYVRHLIHFTPVKRLVLGLDYLMFDADETFIAGFDPDLGSRKYVLAAWPASFFTRQAYDDSELAIKSKTRNDGFWHRNGFRFSIGRDQESLEGVYKKFQRHRITKIQYDQLASLLDRLLNAEVDTAIYLSPMSKPHLEFFEESGDLGNFNVWRTTVIGIAREKGIPVHDFSTSSPFSEEDIREESSDHWVDASHFQPMVGDWILGEMGLIPPEL
ncbi:MAG: hypothetical protein GY780_12225 [bacterium]|nr:hypothetical protein [bacterium]